jgi:hypothetical protein
MKPFYNGRGNMKHTGPYLFLTAMVLGFGTQALAQIAARKNQWW